MRRAASESQDCTVAVGKVTEMTTGICGVANQRAEIARQLRRDHPEKKTAWWNPDSSEEKMRWRHRVVRGVTVADMLATALLAVLSQVPQFNIGARDSVEVSLHLPWMRGSGFSLAHVHGIHLGKWNVSILFLPFKNMVWRNYLSSFNWLACSLAKQMLYFEAKRWCPTFGLHQLI